MGVVRGYLLAVTPFADSLTNFVPCRDLKLTSPNASIYCTDLYQSERLATNLGSVFIQDVNQESWNWSDLDYVNLRNMDGAMKDRPAIFAEIFGCLRDDGHLCLEQLLLPQVPDSAGDRGIWHTWQQALLCVKKQKELSFALYDTEKVKHELRAAGLNIIYQQSLSQVRPRSADLAKAISEIMKGVVVRARDIEPGLFRAEAVSEFFMDIEKGVDQLHKVEV